MRVIICGATAANVGEVKRVSMIRALHEEAGLPVDRCRELCYSVLAGTPVELSLGVSVAARLVARLRDAGLTVSTES